MWNDSNISINVYVSASPYMRKLSSAGLSVGPNAVAVNAAFEQLKASERDSWMALRPNEWASFQLDGGYVSVLSQQDPALGFCTEQLVKAGRTLIVSGTPEPVGKLVREQGAASRKAEQGPEQGAA